MYKTILSTQKRRHALRAHHFRKRFWGGLRDLDITSQGVSTKAIIEKLLSGRANIETDSISGGWEFFYEFGDKRYIKDGKSYNLNCAIGCGGATDHLWTLEPVDSIPLNFDIEANDGNYRTLYTKFPYQYNTDITAFFIENDFGDVLFTPISNNNNIIPAGTPVVLRCTNKLGYIKPIFNESTQLSGENLLVGVLNLNGDTVAYDSTKMKVLGVNSLTKNAEFVISTDVSLKSNTAYLDITSFGNNAKGAIPLYSTTGITSVRQNNSEEGATYDISGRKVSSNNLRKGIYIRNGKKFVIK